MKVLMKPIDMIATFDIKGVLNPIKYRIETENQEHKTILIEKILTRGEEKRAGNRMLIYVCQSTFNEILRTYELRYEVSSCKWYLYKI